MASKPPVHVVSREDGWAVVREGRDRATSVHPTQAEAARAGRDVARKDETTFLLHARDGRVRDRSDYGGEAGGPKEEDKGPAPAGPEAGTVSGMIGAVGGAVGRTAEGAGGVVDRLGRETVEATLGGETSSSRTDDAEEAGDLAHEERYADYEVYDRSGERLGRVDTLFLDESDRPEYIGVKMGFLGTRSTLIPWRTVAHTDEAEGRLEVSVDKETAKNGPAFADDQEITPELEREVHGHYGLEQTPGTQGRGAYADPYSNTEQGVSVPGIPSIAPGVAETGGLGQQDREHHRGSEGLRRSESDPEDEVTVRRAEEELTVDTVRREAGTLRVRKRVTTDRERMEVPVRREEVHVERVPVSGEASEMEIGEDEIVVPVIEEEIVVTKRPVVKEEIRIRKDVVEETETVEEDVRREEIDVQDETTRRGT